MSPEDEVGVTLMLTLLLGVEETLGEADALHDAEIEPVEDAEKDGVDESKRV